MPGEDVLSVRGYAHLNLTIVGGQAQSDVSYRPQHAAGFLIIKHMDSAVGERTQQGWSEIAVARLLPQDRYLDSPMMGREIDATSRRYIDQHLGVSAQAVRLGEWTPGDHAQILAIVATAYAYQRLRRGTLQVSLRQQDSNRTILAAQYIEHGGPDRPFHAGIRLKLPSGCLDVAIELPQ